MLLSTAVGQSALKSANLGPVAKSHKLVKILPSNVSVDLGLTPD